MTSQVRNDVSRDTPIIAWFGKPDGSDRCGRLPGQSATSRSSEGDFDAISIGTVQQADYVGEARLDWHEWRGTAKLTKSLIGHVDAGTVDFGRTGSTAACDDGLKPPPFGEEWVFHFKRVDGRLQLQHSYPLAMAIEMDERIYLYLGSQR